MESFKVRGKTWDARLALTYDDGDTQSISYYVIKPSAHAVADLGNSLSRANGSTIQTIIVSSQPFSHELRSRNKQDRDAGQPRLDCRPRR